MFRAVFLPIIRNFLAVQRHWYILCSSVTVCYWEQDGTGSILPVPAIGSRMVLGVYSQYHPAPDSTRSPNCIKCTNAAVRLKNSWWWAERLPETCRVEIPIIKLELSASVGFIHKEFIFPSVLVCNYPYNTHSETLVCLKLRPPEVSACWFLVAIELSEIAQKKKGCSSDWSRFYFPQRMCHGRTVIRHEMCECDLWLYSRNYSYTDQLNAFK
jgi:hypothetical protein